MEFVDKITLQQINHKFQKIQMFIFVEYDEKLVK